MSLRRGFSIYGKVIFVRQKYSSLKEHLNSFKDQHEETYLKLISEAHLMPEMARVIEPAIQSVPMGFLKGKVSDISGLSLSIEGLHGFAAIGDTVSVEAFNGKSILAEIVAFEGEKTIAMPYEATDGIGAGCLVSFPLYGKEEREAFCGGVLDVNESWIGRILDPLGVPLDGKGPLLPSQSQQKRRAAPPLAASRARLGKRIDLGIKAMDLFTTCKTGQRLGLFAGSGVGKSTLMGMLARNADCDVAVISLVGERGREVREFIEDDLGQEGLARSVVVVATSDSSALKRREAAYSAMAVAEHFRDQGKSVLLLMDSVTRFCQALREIGLSSGEIPATRGYPPSVFATLPKLLERAGPGAVNKEGRAGQITAIFSVLIEGDNHNEPVADAVRGILDGHVVMERSIAEAGRYPAINVLKSLSRTVPGCLDEDQREILHQARAILSTWSEVRDLVRLGAYKQGSDHQSDKAVLLGPKIETYLTQDKNERIPLEQSFSELKAILTSVESDAFV